MCGLFIAPSKTVNYDPRERFIAADVPRGKNAKLNLSIYILFVKFVLLQQMARDSARFPKSWRYTEVAVAPIALPSVGKQPNSSKGFASLFSYDGRGFQCANSVSHGWVASTTQARIAAPVNGTRIDVLQIMTTAKGMSTDHFPDYSLILRNKERSLGK